MSRNSGYSQQCVELDFQYSSEGIHMRWDEGTLTAQQDTIGSKVRILNYSKQDIDFIILLIW